MTTDLNTLIDTIRGSLRECILRHKTYEDITQTTSHEPMNLAVANRQAIGTLSLALVQALPSSACVVKISTATRQRSKSLVHRHK